MNIRTFGIALIVAGALGLAYGGFSVNKATHGATLGPDELRVEELGTVNIPIWVGIGAILAGGAFLLYGNKKI